MVPDRTGHDFKKRFRSLIQRHHPKRACVRSLVCCRRKEQPLIPYGISAPSLCGDISVRNLHGRKLACTFEHHERATEFCVGNRIDFPNDLCKSDAFQRHVKALRTDERRPMVARKCPDAMGKQLREIAEALRLAQRPKLEFAVFLAVERIAEYQTSDAKSP